MIWATYGPSMEMVWHDLWSCCGLNMDFVWDITFHIKPIFVTVFIQYIIYIAFHYGIATYLAALHTFPIAFSMGMIWLSPIPIPYDG